MTQNLNEIMSTVFSVSENKLKFVSSLGCCFFHFYFYCNDWTEPIF